MESLPWGMIGAIFAGLSFLLSLIVYWEKIRNIWRRILTALFISLIVFVVFRIGILLIGQIH